MKEIEKFPKAKKGSEIIEESDVIEVREEEWGNGVVKKNIFLKNSIRDKFVVDKKFAAQLKKRMTELSSKKPKFTLDDYIVTHEQLELLILEISEVFT